MFFTKTAVAALLAFATVSNALTGPQQYKRDLDTREASVKNNEIFESLAIGETSGDLSKRAPDIEIYIAFGNRRKPKQALHWMLVTGGPTQGTAFTPQVQAGKRLDSSGIDSKTLLGTFPAKDLKKFKAAVKAAHVPASGENCQNYVVNALTKLEAKGFVGEGTADHYYNQIESTKTPPPEEGTEDIIDGKDGKK
jgi:hypothetical protein